MARDHVEPVDAAIHEGADGALYNRDGHRVVTLDRVIYNADEIVGPWVRKHSGEALKLSGDYRALGVVKNGELIAGVVYDEWSKAQVQCSIATTDPTWADRAVLRRLFKYAFDHVPRITVLISSFNERSVRACWKMGFQLEARLPMSQVHPETGAFADTIIMRMFQWECPWIDGGDHG